MRMRKRKSGHARVACRQEGKIFLYVGWGMGLQVNILLEE